MAQAPGIFAEACGEGGHGASRRSRDVSTA